MDEIFKPISGYESYLIGTYGTVMRNGKILKTHLSHDGYVLVSLCKDGKCKSFSIHRLVAGAFIENPNNLPQINHKDEDKTNNFVENLEWCDAKYNNNYGTRIKRLSRPIYQIDSKTLNIIKEWDSIIDASKILGISDRIIRNCCDKHIFGRRFIWIYVDEYEQYKNDLIRTDTGFTNGCANKICTMCGVEFAVTPKTKRNLCWCCYMQKLAQKDRERHN